MFTLPALPYAFDALEPYIDTKTMQIHHDKHHGTYVKNTNDALVGYETLATMPIDVLMRNLDKVPDAIRMKIRNNAGGHYNHSLFWTSMTPGGTALEGDLLQAINATFGSFESFQEKFVASALGRFGSGWVWLVAKDKILTIEDTPNQDNPLMQGNVPILGLDVWEHAYYLQYQNLRADYIKAWWKVVHWAEVSKRYALC